MNKDMIEAKIMRSRVERIYKFLGELREELPYESLVLYDLVYLLENGGEQLYRAGVGQTHTPKITQAARDLVEKRMGFSEFKRIVRENS